jgi:magnesium-transporting ATPase (P-type)
MGALALGTEPPSATLLLRRPYKRNASLISNTMIRNILVQYAFQIFLLTYLYNCGARDFDLLSATPSTAGVGAAAQSAGGFSFLNFFSAKKDVAPAIVSVAPAMTDSQTIVLNTIIFNTFVFCQLFNELNSRSITDDMNVFNKLFHNSIFMLIIVTTVVVQVFIVEFGHAFVRTSSLSAEQWVSCIL